MEIAVWMVVLGNGLVYTCVNTHVSFHNVKKNSVNKQQLCGSRYTICFLTNYFIKAFMYLAQSTYLDLCVYVHCRRGDCHFYVY